MILESIVTTVAPSGAVNIAPMGPRVEPGMQRFLLRPFPTARTYQNLQALGEGVLHITDDVLLLARAAVGDVIPLPALVPASCVKGFVLADCCRYYEFRIGAIDTSEPRIRLQAEVVHSGVVRDFFGFNRAKHAVVEAAILATRVHLLPAAEIDSEYRKLKVLIDKTGGEQEHQAFDFLQRHVATVIQDVHPQTEQKVS